MSYTRLQNIDHFACLTENKKRNISLAKPLKTSEN
uniref:Uncharacterized protein n=1 Tax=Anguilla anguilla TaxID=7936 RepID=A0A0E9W2G3_ANGAN